MSHNNLLVLRKQTDELFQHFSQLLDNVEKELAEPELGITVDSYDAMALMLKTKRKVLGLTLSDLELQTGISQSTLKRLFADPENARVGHLLLVCQELGIKLWAAK
jgi:Helix-turn-helix.